MSERLAALLDSKIDFSSRIRMLSENLRLDEALEIVQRQRPDDVRVQGALAALRANRHASRQEWPQAAEAYDQLKSIPQHHPEAWLRTPGLLRLAEMELELADLFGGRDVELRTYEDLSPYFRDRVRSTATTIYDAA